MTDRARPFRVGADLKKPQPRVKPRGAARTRADVFPALGPPLRSRVAFECASAGVSGQGIPLKFASAVATGHGIPHKSAPATVAGHGITLEFTSAAVADQRITLEFAAIGRAVRAPVCQ